MSSKPENTFIAAVHRHLPPMPQRFDEPGTLTLYREKMYNPLRGGTWDVWYSGEKDLWIEYKFLTRIPVRDKTPILPELSALQLEWGRGRLQEGRNLAVIVGCPEGGVVYHNLDWEKEISAGEFRQRVRPRKELADYIVFCTRNL